MNLSPAQRKALAALARMDTVSATTAPYRGAIRSHVLLSLVELELAVEIAPNVFRGVSS